MREGRMANAQLTNYLVPTTLDTPPIDVTILESPYRQGPFGAKGVGEMPMSGPGPAVANAVLHLGLDVRSLPDHAGEGARMRFVLNGKRTDVPAPPLKRLLDVLREDCGLAGTKEGCGEGECGACTVLLDGAPVNSCLVPLAHVRGRKVTTIEGLRSRVARGSRARGRNAVRHLHAGNRDGRGRARAEAQPGARARGPGREPLPVHRLRRHRAGPGRPSRGAAPPGPGRGQHDHAEAPRLGWPPPSRASRFSSPARSPRPCACCATRGRSCRWPGAPISTSASTSGPSASRASSTCRACERSAGSVGAARRS